MPRLPFQEIHPRRADEARDKAVGGAIVKLPRGPGLRDHALVQDHDLVRQGHGLDLIMGHVDHRGFQIIVQFGQFQPHLHAQEGVKVRQGFVEQEHRGVAHQGTTDGDALALTAGQLGGFAL